MLKKIFGGVIIVALLFIFAIIPAAQAKNNADGTSKKSTINFSTTPQVYDPENTGLVSAEWVTLVEEDFNLPTSMDQCKHEGYKNFPINSEEKFANQGQCISAYNKANARAETNDILVLIKDDIGQFTSGLEINGAEDLSLDQLGFDYSGDCGTFGPTFNLHTTEGTYYFNCSSGTHNNLDSEWTRVRFDNSSAVAGEDTVDFPGLGKVTITGMEIVMNEPGKVMLDNIYINGVSITEMDKNK
jgi:hypothetical protein